MTKNDIPNALKEIWHVNNNSIKLFESATLMRLYEHQIKLDVARQELHAGSQKLNSKPTQNWYR
uniref:Uncharacterized protein n=1 Tax=Arion vulgaris TaxID=1028688 RepID=A0A0B7B1N7_9EUPU